MRQQGVEVLVEGRGQAPQDVFEVVGPAKAP